MVSNMSLGLLSWLVEKNNGDVSPWFFLDAEKVPENYKKNLWSIVNEWKNNGLAIQVRVYGAREQQQCDFQLTPLALDAVKAYKPVDTDSVFSRFRKEADKKLETLAPSILEKLSSVYGNLDSENPEDWANAVHSCRRILVDLADALYPPRKEPAIVGGKEIKVGEEQYINRLVQFIAGKSESKTYKDVVGADLANIGKRLDAINDAVCKGTHTEITKNEASRYIIHTYLLISDIVALMD